ncbi:glycerol-3-phosphate 1-O-acyltransferase PlsY [Aliikangiella maris]|uniref:Glycerol-3-phosphate acyltransferase n=2 Tax=Aliikangiella maris TaxID=3162458 RepID=A0ABV3MLI7_9GAMM
MDLTYISLFTFAYLSGSISTAIVVCRILTLPDPRIVGSHNPGATNVHRIGGTKAAILTLFGDMLKTVFPLVAAIYLGYSTAFELIWLGVSGLLGHCFPVFFRFKGGKGVASLFAILIITVPDLSLIALTCWLIIVWSFRRSSIASIATAIIIPIFAYQFHSVLFIPLLFLSAVVVLRHKRNIANIIQGKEPIVGHKS